MTVPVAKKLFKKFSNHTSRKSKKPRVTLPPLKTCSLRIIKTNVTDLIMKFIFNAINWKVKGNQTATAGLIERRLERFA
jgi:hypothetical protein